MPYSINDPDLPSNVKGLSDKTKRQWVHIWNSTYSSCVEDGGSAKTCESKAFRVANGVIKKQEGRMEESNGLLAAIKENIVETVASVLMRGSATKGWEGSASSYGSTEAYCAACAIDVNEGGEKKQSHCMLPYKKGGKASKEGVISAAGRFNQVKNPGVSSEKWSAAVRGAARKLVSAYRSFGMDPPEVLTKAASSQRMLTRTTIKRQDDGRYRWFSVSATSALNRVNEIDTRALFDSMVAIARATGLYPQRDFLHFGMFGDDFVVGQTDFLARDGNTLISSGLYNDSELAQAEILARQHQPENWGDSIAYVPLNEPEIVEREGGDPVLALNTGFCKFISTVPERMAASHFTSGTVQEVNRMALSDKDLQAFNELFQDEEKAVAWLEKHVGDVERGIEEAGMMTRSLEDPDEGDPPAEKPKAEPEPSVEVEAVIARSLEPLLTRINALGEQLNQIIETTNANNDDLVKRLEALEKDEDEKRREWVDDLPPKKLLRISHRPSDPGSNGGDQESYADRAEAAMESWNVDRYND